MSEIYELLRLITEAKVQGKIYISSKTPKFIAKALFINKLDKQKLKQLRRWFCVTSTKSFVLQFPKLRKEVAQ